MNAVILGVLHAPEPVPVADQPHKPTKKSLRKLRHIERRNDDPDGDILPMLLVNGRKQEYKRRMMQRDPHCVFCGTDLNIDNATLEHATPYADGGPDAPWNLFLSCKRCNTYKASTPPLVLLERFRQACERMGLLKDEPEPEIDWSINGATSG